MRPPGRREVTGNGRAARTTVTGNGRAARTAASFALVASVLTACASGPGVPPPPGPAAPQGPATAPTAGPPADGQVRLYGESAAFELDPATERALEAQRTEWKTQPPSQGGLPGHADGRDTVVLPIAGGALAGTAGALRGRVDTDGLAEFTHSGTKLELTDLVLDLDRRTVEATLEGRRVPLFDLDLSRARREDRPGALPRVVDISGRLSEDLRRELGERLGTDLAPEEAKVSIELELRLSPA